jgi:response regulator of citrate/malate metabolism
MDVREILRQLRAGESDRAIGRNLKVNRATVKKYREWAEGEGLLEGEVHLRRTVDNSQANIRYPRIGLNIPEKAL